LQKFGKRVAELRRSFFMSFYDEDRALEYDRIVNQPVYKYYVKKKLHQIRNWISCDSVLLDVGCGTGVYTISLAKNCSDIVGMDISPKMVERGFSKAKCLNLNNTYFVVADVGHFPFRDSAFDLVLSVNLFHHVVDEDIINRGFFEQMRCCKRGGNILVFELNPNSLGWSKDLIPKTIRQLVFLLLFPFRQRVIDNVEGDTRMMCISELLDKLKETDIVLKKIGGFIPTYCPKFLFKVFILLENILEITPLLRRYGAHVLLVGKIPQ
jgi:ubiquinone/menaquinone biosynthesis C-methylase UbiE